MPDDFARRPPSNLLIDEYPLQVLPSLAVAIGLNEAMLLQQLHYWLHPKQRPWFVDGRPWIYNTLQQWREQFPFWSIATIQRILANLEGDDLKLVVSKQFQASEGNHTKWYTIDYYAMVAVSKKAAVITERAESERQEAEDAKAERTPRRMKGGRSSQFDMNDDRRLQPSGMIAKRNGGSSQSAIILTEQRIDTETRPETRPETMTARKRNPKSAPPDPTVAAVELPELTALAALGLSDSQSHQLLKKHGWTLDEIDQWATYADTITGDKPVAILIGLMRDQRLPPVRRTHPTPTQAPPPANPALDTLWQHVLGQLAATVTAADMTTWLRPCRLIEMDDDQAVIAAPLVFVREEVEARFAAMIAATLTAVTGVEREVVVVIGTGREMVPKEIMQ